MSSRCIDKRDYHIIDHLGSLRLVLSDAKLRNRIINANVKAIQNYYPYGSQLANKELLQTANHGFQGKRTDNELKSSGNSYDFHARMYDPRAARWLSADPLEHQFPFSSAYEAMNSNPVFYVDVDGKAAKRFTDIIAKLGSKLAKEVDLLLTMDTRIRQKELDAFTKPAKDEAILLKRNTNALVMDDLPTYEINGKQWVVDYWKLKQRSDWFIDAFVIDVRIYKKVREVLNSSAQKLIKPRKDLSSKVDDFYAELAKRAKNKGEKLGDAEKIGYIKNVVELTRTSTRFRRKVLFPDNTLSKEDRLIYGAMEPDGPEDAKNLAYQLYMARHEDRFNAISLDQLQQYLYNARNQLDNEAMGYQQQLSRDLQELDNAFNAIYGDKILKESNEP